MVIGLYGSLHAGYFSETIPAAGPPFDAAHIAQVAQAHEEAGFDGVLVPFSATAPDNLLTVATAAGVTRHLRFLVSHRPGFVAPTLAARTLATLDQITSGRLGLHLVAGSSNAEQRRDGDYLDHDARFARLEEYLGILRTLWTAPTPVDHDGTYYRFERAFSAVKPVQKHLPVSIGGASPAAIAAAARHADLYPIWAETLDGVHDIVASLKAVLPAGRSPRLGLSLRVILGRTEEEAWQKAREGARKAGDVQLWQKRGPTVAENTGSQRLLRLVEQGEVLDQRLYTGLARVTGAPGSVTALVGTAEQVAEALLRYREIGITDYLFRGLDPHTDAREYGETLIPLLRAAFAAEPPRPAPADAVA